MATLTTIPSKSTRVGIKPRKKSVQFGNGYSQRAGDGINNISEIWSLIFTVRSDVAAQALLDFFEARGGHEAFNWTPPGGTQKKYIATQWSKSIDETQDLNTVNTTLERVFEA